MRIVLSLLAVIDSRVRRFAVSLVCRLIMMMSASRLCQAAALLVSASTVVLPYAIAQPGGRLPAVGSVLPDVQAYDDQGREFSLTELKGNYSVLVFGCLT